MGYQEQSFTTADQHTIHTASYLPDQSDPLAIVIIIHGYGEHFGRYKHVAEALVDAGYAVYGLDHRGHGRSTGERAFFADFKHAVDDLQTYIETVKTACPDKKLFLLGHSMGSLLAMTYALRHQAELAGLILTGTATNGDETVPAWLRFAGNLVRRINPKMVVRKSADLSILTRDEEVLRRAEADEHLWKGGWKAGMAGILLDTGELLRREAHRLTLPLLVMHGTADELTPVSGSQAVYDAASSQDKTLKLWEGMRHEILNEIGRDAVLDTIIDWLNQRIS